MDRNFRMKRLSLIGSLVVVGFLMSCSSTSTKVIDKDKKSSATSITTKEQYEADEQKQLNWQKRISTSEFSTVNSEIHSFLANNPGTAHWYGINFIYGLSFEGMEDWQSAIEIYRGIIDRSFDKQMEFVGLALSRIAYCYEVLLENEKSLAALTDAAKLSAYLPMEINLAEIPARVASVHSRLGQPILADLFTQKAEKGIAKLKAIQKRGDKDLISRTLFRMGSISLTQIDRETFLQNIQTLIRNQRYLIQAVELNSPVWATKSKKLLFSIYNKFWSFIDGYKIEGGINSIDPEAELVNAAKERADFISLYLEAIENLKSFESPEESPNFVITADVYHQVKLLEFKALDRLNHELLIKPMDKRYEIKSKQKKNFNVLKSTKSDGINLLDPNVKMEERILTLPKKRK